MSKANPAYYNEEHDYFSSINTSEPNREDGNDETLVEFDDPHNMGTSNIGTNAALMNLIKGNIGTGILAMPSVTRYCGLLLGPLLIAVVGYISTFLTHVLLRCANDLVEIHGVDRNKLDYTETVFGVFQYGPLCLRRFKGKMKHITNAFMLVTQIGFCCAYMLFISDNIRLFIKDYIGPTYDLKIIAAFVMLLLLVMCWIKNLKIIARVALVANVCALLGVVLIMVFSLMDLQDWRKFSATQPFQDFLVGFGIAIFAFEAINLVLPIQNKMKYPERYVTRAGVVNTAMVFVVSLYVAMSIYGFLKFGMKVEGSITYNLPKVPLWLSPIRPLFILSILTSYLLQMYIPVIIFGKLIQKIERYRTASSFAKKFWLMIIPPSIVIFSFAFAISIPHLDLMLALLGAISSSYLALILPPVLNIVAKLSPNISSSDSNISSSVNSGQFQTESNNESDRRISSSPSLTSYRSRGFLFWLSILSDVLICLFGLVGFIGGTAASLLEIVRVMG